MVSLLKQGFELTAWVSIHPGLWHVLGVFLVFWGVLVWFGFFVLGFLVVFWGFFQLIYSGLENFDIETSKVLLIFVFQLKCI